MKNISKTIVISLILPFLHHFSTEAQNFSYFPKEENSIRIMSYNIRNAKGMDDITEYTRIADEINRYSPDIVALQEIDSMTVRSGGNYILEDIAKECLMYYTYAPAIDFQGGKYGVGILSKEKPVKCHSIPLPGREERRVALIAEFEEYFVCCTHLSLTPQDRELSAVLIVEALKGINKPLFLAGDLNCEYDSEPQRRFREDFKVLNDPKKATFPANDPKTCIDYIYGYTSGGESYSVLRNIVSDNSLASDHRAVVADVRLKAGAEKIFRTDPYLQNPTNRGITISWFTNVPALSWIEYGEGDNIDKKFELFVDGQMICNNKHHKMRLTGLKPGTKYSYRVCSREITLYKAYNKEFGETAYSDVYSFSTPPEGESNFKALIFNDLHKKYNIMESFGELIKEMDYDLVLFNGDCIDDPYNEDEAVGFLSYMNNLVGAAEVPVFYIRGNHEIRNAYSIQLRELFDYVDDRTYNAFNWGDTRFVVLDCGEDKPDTTWVYYGMNDFEGLRRDQREFLIEELKCPDFLKATKKVLIHHIPIYGLRKDAYNPSLELWGDILTEAPFDICLNGHTHRFAYHPEGSIGNNFPVIIGGGNRIDTATLMILSKEGDSLRLSVLNTNGDEILRVE